MSISSNATGLRPGVCTSTTRPTAPYTGMLIYETDTGYLRVWDGSAWDYLSQSQNTAQGLPAGDSMGLVFVKQQTIGNAVSSVAVTNAFSSTYSNYRVVIAHPQSSNNDGLRIQFGSTITGYYGSLFYYLYTGTVTGYSAFNNAANMDVALSDTTANTFTTFDVGNPNAASRTYINGTYWGRGYTGYFSGTEVSSTQHTAFTILPSTAGGTLTGGKIYVYGYRND